MTQPLISVIVVSYNTAQFTIRAIASAMAAAGSLDVEVVVVDNGSTDESVGLIATEFPSIKVIAIGQNLGFGRACNIGARSSSGQHIMLLNPDAVLQAGSFDALLRTLVDHPEAKIAGGISISSDGITDVNAPYGLPSLWSSVCFALGLSTVLPRSRFFNTEAVGGWGRDSEREVGVVPGFLLMCTKATWDELGGFDETFFMYGEDVDLSLRVRQAGGHPRVTPQASVVHDFGGASSSKLSRSIMIMRGKVTVMSLRWSPARARGGIFLLLAGTWLRASAIRLGVPVAGAWDQVWRARDEWRAGWPTPELSVDLVGQ